jgi:uncharacterized membrane protein YeaQ/YmgE (transglycosylase-associated protein family)
LGDGLIAGRLIFAFPKGVARRFPADTLSGMNSWLWFILIGLAAGFLAGVVMKGHGFGVLGNMVVGILGALLGGFLFGLLGMAPGNLLGNLVCAFVGAVVLLILIGFVRRKGA